MHMLIATNGSQIAVDAAQRATGLFGPTSQVTLLNVLTTVPGENVDDLELEDESPSSEDLARQWELVTREAGREFARTGAVLSTAHVDTRVDAGDVAQTICRVAREVGADVIVVGTHMHHGLERVVRRSTAERVVRHAPCAVLIVPEREGAVPPE